MKTKLNLYFVVTLILGVVALPLVSAEFKEGSINLQMQTPQGDVEVKLKVSEKAVRSNVILGLGQFKMDLTFLLETKASANLYQINDAAKTYSKIDLQAGATNIQNEKVQKGTSISYSNVKIKSLGKAKILGYEVDHLSLTSDEFDAEIWVAPKIALFSTLKKLQEINKGSSSQREIFNAMEQKGYQGFPLKMWWKEKKGAKLEMYVTEIKAEKLPAALFEIPKDYQLSKGFSMSSPQGAQNIQKILENLTPEQKAALLNGAREPEK